MILLDTNVLSELTRPSPEPKVVRWLETRDAQLALSTITLAELRYGIARLSEGRRKSSLLTFWDHIRDQFAGRTHAFDERAAEAYGDLAAAAERAGTRVNVADGQIAAIARVHGLAVATRDKSDFAATGVAVVDPWAQDSAP